MERIGKMPDEDWIKAAAEDFLVKFKERLKSEPSVVGDAEAGNIVTSLFSEVVRAHVPKPDFIEYRVQRVSDGKWLEYDSGGDFIYVAEPHEAKVFKTDYHDDWDSYSNLVAVPFAVTRIKDTH